VVITDLDDTGVPGGGGQDRQRWRQDPLSSSRRQPRGELTRVIDATERRFGRLDVMVANAGIGILCKAIEMSLADWRRQTAVNLDGVFLSVKYAVPAMRRAGGGSIIIMSSVAGLRGSAGLAGYCAHEGRRAPVREGSGDGNVQRPVTVSGSTQFIPASSTRRFGRSYQRPPGTMGRSIRMMWPKPGCRSEGLGRRRISLTGCCSSPPTRPAT
jgi:hypothetical protein